MLHSVEYLYIDILLYLWLFVSQKAQAGLKAKIQELCVSLDQEMKSKVQLEDELQEWVQKLQECEKQNVELQQQQHNFTIESSDTARRLESSIEIKQAKIDELQVTLADLKAVFEVDLKCQQAIIAELKAANEELNAKINQSDVDAQQKLNKQEELMTESRNKWDELEHKHLDMINQLTADKKNLAEQMKGQNEVHEVSGSPKQTMYICWSFFPISDTINQAPWRSEAEGRRDYRLE